MAALAAADAAALTRAFRAFFAEAADPVVDDVLSAWPAEPETWSLPAASPLPVLDHLPTAFDALPDPCAALARALAAAALGLNWQQTYTAEDMGEAFLRRYGWTLVAGPGGLIEQTGLIAGFLLLGPDVDYPPHRHSAEEIYRVVAGRASWKVGDADRRPLPPGAVVHNPPWQPHGMRTDIGEPLLAAAVWRTGDLEKSTIL